MDRINALDGSLGMTMVKQEARFYLNPKQLSDEDLVKAYTLNREQESFNEIVSRYRDKIYWVALKITNNTNDAEDIVQEVLFAIYKKAKTFRGDSKFSTWLYRLATNESITKLRQRKREKELSLDEYMPQFAYDGHHSVRPVVDWSQDVDKIVFDKECCQLIQQAMEQLSPLDRAVVVLSELEEMSNPEIGKALGLSVQAVKARLHRSRLFLRGKLAVYFGYSPA